ncbi:MAG: alpha-glucosidase/alpha-galactosidase [Candidatus Sumerlaeota bacterium]|nr:alpha-glucosidase/alpha-galactosidase [Candidatus Sumerlaeota bacterium]
MPKITFMGAGSTVFVKNIIGDCLCAPALREAEVALYDIDRERLDDSFVMLKNLNHNINEDRMRITTHLGPRKRPEALCGADYVVNAIQVGGYEPSTVIDFEIPKKYGLRQTIGDTLGIGGIFRALRTIPVLQDFADDMAKACPDAWFLNYVNPMAMLSGYLQRYTAIKTVGLCHSVQGCAEWLLKNVGLWEKVGNLRWKIAGINHQAWLLEIADGGKDLYPEIKRRAAKIVREARPKGAKKSWDMVRLEMMRHFGYYITESSEHNAEYTPYWIKSLYPEMIEEFNIPLDEYPRRCVAQIAGWKKQREELARNAQLDHQRTHEFGSYILEAIETGAPARIHGNVLNRGFITNLSAVACVEVPCLVDRNGVQGCHVGALPVQCAALNMTNINTQLMTIEAAVTRRKEHVYQAAMLDPHTGSELTLDQICALCDDLIEAHGRMLPKYK